MFDALLVGFAGGLLHGLFYALFGDAAWLNTLIKLSLLGLLGGLLMSPAFKSGRGFSARNILSAFLMGLLPATIYLYAIGSDSMPLAFGVESGFFTLIPAIAALKLVFPLKKP